MIHTKVVASRRKIESLLLNGFLIVLCMYAANPFFFENVERLNKMAYYGFCLLAIPLMMMEKRILRRKYTFFICYILLYLFLVIVIAQQGDNTYVEYFIRQLQRLLGMISVVLIWKKLFRKNYIGTRFEIIYLSSIVLYVCSTFYFVFNHSAKLIWNDMIVSYQEQYLIEWKRFATRFGFAGWSSFDISIWCVIGFIYLYYIYLRKRIRFQPFAFTSFFLVVASSIYARSGILLSILMIIFITFNELKKKKTRYLGYVLAGVAFIIVSLIMISRYNTAAQESIEWMLEFLIGGGKSGSTGELWSMYQNFSPSFKTLLIGDGRWNLANGGYYGAVDVGILRNILFGGIPYTIFEYGIGVYFVFLVSNNCKYIDGKLKKNIPIMIAIVMIFCEFKGDLIFYNLRMLIPFLWITGVDKQMVKDVSL